MVSDNEKHKVATCPACGQTSEFTDAGIQKWPEHVVKSTGLPPEMHLWTCQNCKTTLTDLTLKFHC